MAAKFLAFGKDPDGVRVAISEIGGYKTAYSGTGTLIYLKARKDGDYTLVDETVEEIDEMLLRAKHSTAAVVRKTDVEKWHIDITAPAARAPHNPMKRDKRWTDMADAIVTAGRKAETGETPIIKVEDDETLEAATVPAIRVVTRGSSARSLPGENSKTVTRFAVVERNGSFKGIGEQTAKRRVFELVFNEDYDIAKGSLVEGIGVDFMEAAFIVASYYEIVRGEGK